MFQKLVAVTAWALLAFIAYATLSPIQARPTVPTPANFEHFTAFAALGGLFSVAYPKRTGLVCILVFGSAALLEIAQLYTPDRHARFADAIQKLAGGAFGMIVVIVVRQLVRRDRTK